MNEKMEIMKKEIGEKYEKVEVEKDFYTKEVKKFNDLIKYFERIKASYNKILTTLLLKSSAKNMQLNELEYYKKLNELEKKMQENYNIIHGISTYIETKSSESSLTQIAKEVLDIQGDINQELIKNTLSVNVKN